MAFKVILQPIQDSEHPTLPVWCSKSELDQISITCMPMGLTSFLHMPGYLFTLVTTTGSVQFSSVTQSCPTLCNAMDCSMPGSPVLHRFPKFAQIHVHESVMLSNHFILCHPLLLLPSVSASIRVFSSKSALCIKWPKHWNFSFSINPSNEYSGLISFGID